MAWEKIQTEFGTVAKCQWTWRGVPDESFYSDATHHPIDDYIKKIKELESELYNTKKDLGEEQNKNKQLEKDNGELKKEKTQLGQDKANLTTELTNKDNDISQKDKSINSLQLKNEKLSESYKKLIQHLADARQLVSHLQNDLAVEKQDKSHIQKELEDALAILNKPTSEMGTQTDLTAEQITQMEKLLYEGSQEIGRLEREMETIRTEQTQKETEINQLKDQVKDLEPNPTERQLMVIYSKYFPLTILTMEGLKSVEKIENELKSGKNDGKKWDWVQLRKEYSLIRNELINIVDKTLSSFRLSQKLDKEVEARNQLQTKYDMEVRSKEELSKELQKEKQWLDNWVLDSKCRYQREGLVLKHLIGKRVVEDVSKSTKISNHRWKLYSEGNKHVGMEDEFGSSDIFFGIFFKEVIYKHYRNRLN